MYKTILAYIVVIVILILLWNYLSPKTGWQEWVPEGPEPTCGSGVRTYRRKCTINGIVQSTIDACRKLDPTSASDTKEVTYVLPVPCTVKGRYIRLERSQSSGQVGIDANVISVGEIVAYDAKGNDITVGAIAKSPTQYVGYPPSNVIDKNDDTFSHTASGIEDFANIWLEIDLGQDKDIAKLKLVNRKDCCQERLVGTQIRISDASGKVVYISPVISLDDSKKSLLEFMLV